MVHNISWTNCEGDKERKKSVISKGRKMDGITKVKLKLRPEKLH